MSVNVCVIGGNVGSDPEMKQVGQNQLATCSLAYSEKRKGESVTTWFKVNMWGKRAENFAQYVKKGDKLVVTGKVVSREYVDRTGSKKMSLEIEASDWDLQRNGGGSGGGGSKSSYSSKPQESRFAYNDEEDEIPF